MANDTIDLRRLTFNLVSLIATPIALYYAVSWLFDQLDPLKKRNDVAKKLSAKAIQRLQKSVKDANIRLKDITEHETVIMSEVITPDELNVKFEDIGGLEDIISSVKETVIYPLVYPDLFRSASGLLSAPRGVLLYGPPGCGKTMLAKAMAAESGATFINLHMSTLSQKWFGESERLVDAVFSLAHKLQPAIIFIDEIDSFLRERTVTDHEVTGNMKAGFMTRWDGLTTEDNTRIIVLGATNLPNALDPAVLRRLPKRYSIGLPNAIQRRKIFDILLKKASLASDFSMDRLVTATEGYSGSDIKEMCRNAAMIPLREYLKLHKNELEQQREAKFSPELRPLTTNDFLTEFEKEVKHIGEEDMD